MNTPMNNRISDPFDPKLQGLTDHVVICNCNEKVPRIVCDLHRANTHRPDVVLVIQDHKLWQENPRWHPTDCDPDRFFTVVGCPTAQDCLSQINIGKARAAIILADPNHGGLADARSTLVAVAIERHSPQVHTVIELIASVNQAHLNATEVNEVICLGNIAEKLIAQSCITPGVKNIFDSLLSVHPDTNQIFVCSLGEELSGRTFRSLARRTINNSAPFLLCGFIDRGRGGDPETAQEPLLVMNPRANEQPGKDSILHASDQLVVISYSVPDLAKYLRTD